MSPERAASNALLRTWCRDITGDVLSIGSATDQDGAGTRYRDYFPQASSYTTSEPFATPFCDRVLDVRAMPEVAGGSFDALFLSGVLEHVDYCHGAVAECQRVLRPGGVLLLGLPFKQRLHRVPQDFWRFTEYGISYLLRDMTIEAVEAIGSERDYPATYWVRAITR